MLDLILLLIACFVIFLCFLLFLPFAVIGIDILCALFRKPKSESNCQSYSGNQFVKRLKEEPKDDIIEDSINDSEGDGLMLFDDPLFPSEEDD